jgi:CubicO group peptidase (beta-lactamase class C family)
MTSSVRQAFIPALGAVLRGSVIVVLGLLLQALGPVIGVTSALAQATSEHGRERAIALSAISLGRSDSIIRRFVAREHIPGLAVAVGREGSIVWENAYGFADLENRTPTTLRTLFRIGSISKAITAVAILQLAERGKLNLDSSIQQYLPGFPQKRLPVTLRRLLTGTSGVRGYRGEEFRSNQHYPTLDSSLPIFRDDSLADEPGMSYVETPYGFTLLGLALQAVTGRSYEAYVTDNVLAVAHMVETKADVPAQTVQRRTHFYSRDSTGALSTAESIDPSYKIPAGGWLSTARDVARFGIALTDHTMLRPESNALMTRPVRLINGSELPLGMGLALGNVGGQFPVGTDAVWTSGLQQGGTAVLLMYPRERIVVVILMNVNGELGAPAFELMKRTTLVADSLAMQFRRRAGSHLLGQS